MAKGSIAALLLASIAATAAADAEEQRLDFKGLPLGSTEAQLKAHTPVACKADSTGEFDRVCVVRDKANRFYAERPARDLWFGFFADRLDTVMVMLSPREFDSLKHAMDGKFGDVTPDAGLTERSTYRMNGDRAYLYRIDGATVVRYEAAAGNEERARRWDAERSKVRKDM